ncbi:MAG TPA: LysR family transcriptional regulator, partial [Acidimicrobiales bacterium]
MTLSQLKVFVLVARLGSVKAAALALGVSEPAVSQALTALRQSLGDQLLVRSGSAMELTPAGQRVVGIASQMVNLAVEAEAAVRQSQGAPELLRVVATSTIATSVAPALLQAFTSRGGGVEVTLGTASTAEMRALLLERLADVVLGPNLEANAGGIESAPLMRYRIVFVAERGHRLATGGPNPLTRLAAEPWCVDPTGTDRDSDVGQVLARLGVPEARVRVFATAREAWAAIASGQGIGPAVEQL